MSKTIGILTSGGDCAGLNAIIRAVVHAASAKGWRVLGIQNGTHGLLVEPYKYKELEASEFDGTLLRQGGTVLGTTNKGDPFAFPMGDGTLKDRSSEITDGLKALGIDALIGIGGDGSLAILRKLCQQGGVSLIGVPKTIDNDLGMTEVSVGFDTAVAVATEALDRLQPTAASHDRVMILEVMGRDAGHIALQAGIAGGADVILVPEIPYSIDAVAAKIRDVKSKGRNFSLMVVSEAVKTIDQKESRVEYADGQVRFGGIGQYVGDQVARATGFETRVTVLGHVQRGSAPTHTDRIIAAAFGVKAVDLIDQGKTDRMVSWSDRGVIDVALAEAVASYKVIDPQDQLIATARALGICLGDENP